MKNTRGTLRRQKRERSILIFLFLLLPMALLILLTGTFCGTGQLHKSIYNPEVLECIPDSDLLPGGRIDSTGGGAVPGHYPVQGASGKQFFQGRDIFPVYYEHRGGNLNFSNVF